MLLWSLSRSSSNMMRTHHVIGLSLLLCYSCQQIPPQERGSTSQTVPDTKSADKQQNVRPVDRVEWPDEPLDDTPAAVTFVSLTRAKNESLRAKVRIFNFTEKDLAQLELELLCRDVDGRSIPCIKPWSTTRNVPARSHVTHVIGAHLPAESDSIEVSVIHAQFADGNKWPEKLSQ